jgi:IclR family acetate operon transcriptional repressor
MTRPEASKSSRYTVGSVGRALDILDVIAGSSDGLSLTEISAAIQTSKSATYALLQTMVERGHVRELGSSPRYQLGVELLRLADAAVTQLPLVEIVHPVLTDLSNELGMTTRLALADNGLPIFIDRVDGPGAVRFHAPLGKREAPHVSAAGKAILATLTETRVRAICEEQGMPVHTPHTLVTPDALLADLERVKARGFATDDEEDAEGVVCVGATFVDHRGACAGAISATFIKLSLTEDRLAEIGSTVIAHADRISMLLGASKVPERVAR